MNRMIKYFPATDSELTAYLRGLNVKKSWKNKLSTGIDPKFMEHQI